MSSSFLRAGRFALPLIAAVLIATPALASDKALNRNTLVFFSTDDAAGYRAAMAQSDAGAFMKDPQIQEITSRLQEGFVKMFSKAVASASGEEQEQLNAATGLFQDYWKVLNEKVTGRFAFSLGFLELEGGAIQPDLLIHMQGGEEIDEQHGRIYEFLGGVLAGAPMAPISAEMAGASFKGYELKEEMPDSPVAAPDGIFMGRKGNDYYIGFSKRGLTEYISASAGGATAVGGRLGSDADYTRALAATGAGQSAFYLNLPCMWRLMDRFLPMAGPDADEVRKVIDAVGLRNMGGMYGTGTVDASGARSTGFFGVSGRDGVMKILPAANSRLTMPAVVPRDVITASAVRLELSKALDIAFEIAGKIGGDEAKQEMTTGLGEFEQEMGVKLADLLGALEGTMFQYSQPSGSGGMGMGMGMGMGAGLGKFVFGFKLNDPTVFTKFLEALASHEQVGAAMKSEEFMEHKVYVINPMGDTPPEFGGAGAVPTPALVVSGNWFLFGISAEAIQEAIRTGKGEDEGRLTSDPEFRAAMAPLGGNAISIAYVDQAKYIGEMVDMIRPMIGFIPMMVPDLSQNADLLFLFNPQNLPPSSLFARYFGKTGQSCSIVDGGMVMKTWAPTVHQKKPVK